MLLKFAETRPVENFYKFALCDFYMLDYCDSLQAVPSLFLHKSRTAGLARNPKSLCIQYLSFLGNDEFVSRQGKADSGRSIE